MLFIYNLLLILIGILLSPFLVLAPKYRKMLSRRLGMRLAASAGNLPGDGPRIWIHALSVGEVSSARALTTSIKKDHPEVVVIFSATTRSGFAYAEEVLGEHVDLLIPFPFDLYWTTEKFIRILQPDLFVLIETDLWPNFLSSLERNKTKAVLINGRISESSAGKYQRFRFFFAPLFNVFARISMQTDLDKERMMKLGVNKDRLLSLGNLKYGVLDLPDNPSEMIRMVLPEDRLIWVAGSTHQGEEEVVLDVYRVLAGIYPELFLVIAPRDISRKDVIVTSAGRLGLRAVLRSSNDPDPGDLLILDTFGELASVYACCAMVFIGGSLVKEGGHNPLEPAALAKPVVFGPHMEDFPEVAKDLLDSGGAEMVRDRQGLEDVIRKWLDDGKSRKEAGDLALGLVRERQEVTDRHLDLIMGMLSGVEDE